MCVSVFQGRPICTRQPIDVMFSEDTHFSCFQLSSVIYNSLYRVEALGLSLLSLSYLLVSSLFSSCLDNNINDSVCVQLLILLGVTFLYQILWFSDSFCPLFHNVPSILGAGIFCRHMYWEWNIQLCILITCGFLKCVLCLLKKKRVSLKRVDIILIFRYKNSDGC